MKLKFARHPSHVEPHVVLPIAGSQWHRSPFSLNEPVLVVFECNRRPPRNQ
jgi:hypothetical protein